MKRQARILPDWISYGSLHYCPLINLSNIVQHNSFEPLYCAVAKPLHLVCLPLLWC